MTDNFTALMPKAIDAMDAFSKAYDSIKQTVPVTTNMQNIQPLNIEFSSPLITIGQADNSTAADIRKLVPDIAIKTSENVDTNKFEVAYFSGLFSIWRRKEKKCQALNIKINQQVQLYPLLFA